MFTCCEDPFIGWLLLSKIAPFSDQSFGVSIFKADQKVKASRKTCASFVGYFSLEWMRSCDKQTKTKQQRSEWTLQKYVCICHQEFMNERLSLSWKWREPSLSITKDHMCKQTHSDPVPPVNQYRLNNIYQNDCSLVWFWKMCHWGYRKLQRRSFKECIRISFNMKCFRFRSCFGFF